MKRALLLCALITVGCGGESGMTPATPTPVSTRVTVNVTLTETLSGGPLGSVSQEVSSLPAMVTLSAAGHLTRQTMVGSATPTVDLIADAPPFSLDFYRQLVRNGHEAPNALTPLRIISTAPSLYIRTVDDAGQPIDAATLATARSSLIATVGTWTGGRFSFSTIDQGDAQGFEYSISVRWLNPVVPGICGRAGSVARIIELNYLEPACACNGSRMRPRAVKHELGHALGFFHTDAPSDLMYIQLLTCDQDPSPREQYHAAIAYHRQAGNRDPDIDAPTATPLSGRSVIVVD